LGPDQSYLPCLSLAEACPAGVTDLHSLKSPRPLTLFLLFALSNFKALSHEPRLFTEPSCEKGQRVQGGFQIAGRTNLVELTRSRGVLIGS